MRGEYIRETIIWRGITIEIGWQEDYFTFDDETQMGHLEVRTISPEYAPLPITNTGYRSHFIRSDELYRVGEPVAYVETWIAQEAIKPEWIEANAKRNQLELF